MLFNGVEYEAQKRLQKQVRDHVKASANTPYYATYNLLNPEDAETFRKHGVGEKIREFFRQGEVGDNVGNEAIACRLEQRLVQHVEEQLPRMFRRFTRTLRQLDTELEQTTKPMKPSWNTVEHLALIYARLVDSYVLRSKSNIGVVPGRGLFGVGVWPTERVLSIMGSGSYEGKMERAQMMYLVQDTVKMLDDLMMPAKIYMDPQAADSLLHWPTAKVIEEANLKTGVEHVENSLLTPPKVARLLGIDLYNTLEGQIKAAADRMKCALIGSGSSNGLCQEFYRSVAQVEFRNDT